MVASVKAIINPSRHSDTFFRLVDDIPVFTDGAIRDSMFDVGSESAKFLKFRLTTGPRTGRRYRIFGRIHQASAPGEFPARLTGKMSRNTAYSVRGTSELEVGIKTFGGTPYPKFLEEGTRKMERRPFIEPTSDKYANQMAIELAYYTRVSLSKRLGVRFKI